MTRRRTILKEALAEWDIEDCTVIGGDDQEGEGEGEGGGEGGDSSDEEGENKGKGGGGDPSDEEGEEKDGEGGGSSDEEGDGEEKDGEGDGSSDKEGEEKDGEGDGKGDEPVDLDKAKKQRIDPDQLHKEIENSIKNKKDGEKPKDADQSKKNSSSGKGSDFGGGARQRSVPQKAEWKFVPPKYNWRKLLDRLVSNAASKTEETYTKMSKSAATQTSILAQRGKATVKPGEKQAEGQLKLAFIVDSSGSMSADIPVVFAELQNLLKKYKRLDNELIFIRFSDSHEMFKINIKKNKARKVQSIDDKKSSTEGEKSADVLFKEHYGAGTDFNAALVSTANQLLQKGYYIFIISDTDLLGGSNAANLKDVIKNKNANVMFATKGDYEHAIKAFGARANMTYIREK